MDRKRLLAQQPAPKSFAKFTPNSLRDMLARAVTTQQVVHLRMADDAGRA